MIINMTGGGAGLNLKVVGGTAAPANPAENTVWVNTDTEISGYTFSATEPENPVEGVVWFKTGTTSNASMNIDKKNTVMLYPNSCSQYTGGAWVSKTAKTYLNSAWKDWTVYLYNLGDECTSITGGWDDYYDNAGYAITKGADYLKIKGVNSQYSGTGSTTNAIDLTKYKTLHVLAKRTSSGTCYIGISSKRDVVQNDLSAKTTITAKEYTEVALDISGYNSAYYIVLVVTATDELYIQKIWLE